MNSLGSVLAFVVTCATVAAGSAKAPESAFDQDPWPTVKAGPVKVFILAGQSNMQGHAALRTLEYLIYNEETAPEYQQWKDRWGDWYERGDVWIWTTDGERHGNLKPGFGQNEKKMGPELGFGWVAGEAFNEQVLLYDGRTVRHYALSNHKEYCAEGTEAYFYRNDFYPFCRAELERHDSRLHELLVAIWGPCE